MKRPPHSIAFALVAALALAGALFAAACGDDGSSTATPSAPTPTASQGAADSFADLVAEVRPSVVHIQTQAGVAEFGRSAPSGVGTGFVIDTSGHIVTNNHVVSLPGSTTPYATITVTLAGGATYEAEFVGGDLFTDIAVIRVDADAGDLHPVALGSLSNVRVGDTVLALGHALDLAGGPTVTRGVVSATGRAVTESDPTTGGPGVTLTDAIQTDAAINPGNSGGPLVAMDGSVIGVNAVVQVQTDTGIPVQGIGYAISVDTVKSIAAELMETGEIRRAFLGIQFTDVPRSFLRGRDIDAEGAVGVVAVTPDSPAAAAGLQPGDIITGIDDTDIRNNGDLTELLRKFDPGSEVTVHFYRNGEGRDAAVTLMQRPDPQAGIAPATTGSFA